LRNLRCFSLIAFFALALGGCREEPAGLVLTKDRQVEQQPAQNGFQCVDIDALIPRGQSVEGKTCKENKAVINGHSDKCLVEEQCNQATRLAEFNQKAEAVCAEWCANKDCDYDYTKRDKCDSAFCVKYKDCQNNCNLPFLDHCSIHQAKPNYNCQCKDKVQGKPIEG